MSESRNQNQMVLYVLGGIIVLLVAVVGVLVARNQSPVPANVPVANNAANPNAGANANGNAPVNGQPQQPAVDAGPFDPKTATKVPAGTDPAAFINLYYENVKAGKYAEAYKILPKDKQAYYGTPESYEQTLKGYGISGVSVDKPVIGKDTVSVTGWQQTQMGSFGYTWNLVKVGNDWYVKSREQAGTK